MTRRFDLKLTDWAFFALIFAALLPWIAVQWNRSVNGNVAWLTICAQRWLSGTPLSEGCYDTNPPFSILLYTPPVLLNRLTGLELYYSIYLIALVLIVVCACAIRSALKHDPALNASEKKLVLLSYLLSTSVLSSISFADKDHIIAIILPALVLLQRAMTHKADVAKIMKYAVLALGGIAILIKPPFAIIPALMILHRVILQKRPAALYDPDALVLTAFVCGYALMLFALFQDFLTIILPDILRYYLPYNNPAQTWAEAKPLALAILLSAGIGLATSLKTPEKGPIVLLFNLCAFLCLLVYMLQMKGLNYQLLPAYAFLVPAIALGLSVLTNKDLKQEKQRALAGIALSVACIAAVYVRAPLRPNYPTHEDYKNAELTLYIRDHCGNPCSYLVTHENMEIISQTAFYLGETYATRFIGFWYIALLEGNAFPEPAAKRSSEEPPERTETRNRFASYAAQDLARFKPEIILILTTTSQGSDRSAFDYFDYFSQNTAFSEQALNYEKAEAFKTDRAYYFRDTRHDYEHILTWDVFKRKDDRQTPDP
ncbi:MAG: hypothetical protein KJ017_02930 [Alphaproteobacteria bacterium]|nr:hypothetical protein [Alphaproteobacteria bacterium]